MQTKVTQTQAIEYWEKYANLYQFEEGSPEYLIDKEDFLNFAQQNNIEEKMYTRSEVRQVLSDFNKQNAMSYFEHYIDKWFDENVK